jgi:hypothetical protein
MLVIIKVFSVLQWVGQCVNGWQNIAFIQHKTAYSMLRGPLETLQDTKWPYYWWSKCFVFWQSPYVWKNVAFIDIGHIMFVKYKVLLKEKQRTNLQL